ncbi:MAG: GntR family transcriptional regulator [Paramuribaculum sp.]|nr:GntR family transcriptional regulator [Paramuribaculum sp.]
MEFNETTPIYKQIIDYCFRCISSGMWREEQRIPSVREMAVELTVNSHTVLKAYEHLQNHGIIAPRRGMGFYLEPDARQRVDMMRREEFFDTELPQLFSTMRMLDIDIDDIIPLWHK